tara:strand:+ start:313 stop:777 length:465 start_codon:yes stop_codon:yes gene_type:complete
LPEGITPVSDFEINKYLGKWYEIARLDHSFERGLDKVSAEYSLREDGGIKVVNKGYSNRDKDWSEAEGKAYFVKSKDEGLLKVSFFGPFYGSYIIFELDKENYQYSFVAGNSRSYLWLLSRTPTVSQDIIDKFVIRSKELGFEIEKLIYVNQSR